MIGFILYNLAFEVINNMLHCNFNILIKCTNTNNTNKEIIKLDRAYNEYEDAISTAHIDQIKYYTSLENAILKGKIYALMSELSNIISKEYKILFSPFLTAKNDLYDLFDKYYDYNKAKFEYDNKFNTIKLNYFSKLQIKESTKFCDLKKQEYLKLKIFKQIECFKQQSIKAGADYCSLLCDITTYDKFVKNMVDIYKFKEIRDFKFKNLVDFINLKTKDDESLNNAWNFELKHVEDKYNKLRQKLMYIFDVLKVMHNRICEIDAIFSTRSDNKDLRLFDIDDKIMDKDILSAFKNIGLASSKLLKLLNQNKLEIISKFALNTSFQNSEIISESVNFNSQIMPESSAQKSITDANSELVSNYSNSDSSIEELRDVNAICEKFDLEVAKFNDDSKIKSDVLPMNT